MQEIWAMQAVTGWAKRELDLTELSVPEMIPITDTKAGPDHWEICHHSYHSSDMKSVATVKFFLNILSCLPNNKKNNLYKQTKKIMIFFSTLK